MSAGCRRKDAFLHVPKRWFHRSTGTPCSIICHSLRTDSFTLTRTLSWNCCKVWQDLIFKNFNCFLTDFKRSVNLAQVQQKFPAENFGSFTITFLWTRASKEAAANVVLRETSGCLENMHSIVEMKSNHPTMTFCKDGFFWLTTETKKLSATSATAEERLAFPDTSVRGLRLRSGLRTGLGLKFGLKSRLWVGFCLH